MNTQKIPFDSSCMNVIPFLFRRNINDILPLCIIFEVSQTDLSYSSILPFIHSIDLSLGKGFSIDTTKPFPLKQIKSSSFYIVDLRKIPDMNLNPITFSSDPQSIDTTLKSSILQTLLDKSLGLIILADDHNQIPNVMFTRSHYGFTSKPSLQTFLTKGNSLSFPHGIPVRTSDQLKNQTLCGYSNIFASPTYCTI